MESWALDLADSAENADLVIVCASDEAKTILNTDEEEIEEHGEYDPHLWLSLSGAAAEVQNIADAFSEADEENASYYQNNCASYIDELNSLMDEYSEKFKACESNTLVTSHAAFAYFCRDFDLIQQSVEGVYAEGEPSTKQLLELVDFCSENNITTIFSEEAASSDIASTLAEECGASVDTIYTMESSEGNLSYLERIRSNCEKILQSLSQ